MRLSWGVIGVTMNDSEFQVAVGAAAQDAVWQTQHPVTYDLAGDDPRRAQYLREYQESVGRRVLAAIKTLRPRTSIWEHQEAPAAPLKGMRAPGANPSTRCRPTPPSRSPAGESYRRYDTPKPSQPVHPQ